MSCGSRFLACFWPFAVSAGRWGKCALFAHRRLILRGQATIEGAFLIPMILLMLMMLIQPGILLYDRMVMNAAASEGCRLITTCPVGESTDAYEGYIRRRLGSVPQQDNFHVHGGRCTWNIALEGNEGTSKVGVTIENQVKPLPFFDFGARALGMVNDEGNFAIKVHASSLVKSNWVTENSQGLDPEAWVAGDGSTAKGSVS